MTKKRGSRKAAKLRLIAEGLTDREGTCLRYITSPDVELPVHPRRVVNKIEWSPLPHSYLEARATFEALRAAKLIARADKQGYIPTDLGRDVIAQADKIGLYRKPIGNTTSTRRK